MVSDKGHFSLETPIAEYGDKFITGWLIKHWSQVTEVIARGKEAPVTENDVANEEVAV